VFMKYVLLIVLVLMILIMLLIANILLLVHHYGKKYIIGDLSILEKLDSVIVLGAGVRPDGNPCDLLADRIKTGVEVYLNNKCDTILLTGEEKDETYNEVLVMKRWIKKNYGEIDTDVILLDGLGLCTYDSMCRARYIFNIN
ncbi:YdcF family protein, partial [Clostridium saudiense]|nr:YdcF family protein [Clostridium saudiense]